MYSYMKLSSRCSLHDTAVSGDQESRRQAIHQRSLCHRKRGCDWKSERTNGEKQGLAKGPGDVILGETW